MLKHSKGFTDGPWFVVEANHQMSFEETTVCEVNYLGQKKQFFVGSKATYHGEAEATAKLIAAAPDMLDALNYVTSYIRRSLTLEGKLSEKEITVILEKPEAAIEKATK